MSANSRGLFRFMGATCAILVWLSFSGVHLWHHHLHHPPQPCHRADAPGPLYGESGGEGHACPVCDFLAHSALAAGPGRDDAPSLRLAVWPSGRPADALSRALPFAAWSPRAPPLV